MSDERRAGERFDMTEMIFVSGGGKARAGLLIDLSPKGAQVDFSDPLGRTPHQFAEGETVELIVDSIGEMPATVRRVTEKGLALEFQIDDQQQEMMVAEIEAAFGAE